MAIVVEADATTYRPAQAVDCVYFSYALTMIPDWRAAVDNALGMLRPGGLLGVVDFYAAPRNQPAGSARPAPGARLLAALVPARRRPSRPAAPALSAGAVPSRFAANSVAVRVPYLPGLRVPYYLYIGRKSAT